MKVLLFIDSVVAAGAQRQMLMLANVLHERGIDILLVHYADVSNYIALEIPEKINTYYLDKKSRGFLGMLKEFRRVTAEFSPDIIISYLTAPNLYVRFLKLTGLAFKHIASERNIDLPRYRLRFFLEWLTQKLSDHLVVNCHAAKDMLISQTHTDPEKISVIYNAIDTKYFSRSDLITIEHFRSGLNIASNDIFIILPGRIVYQKNHPCLLRAIAILKNTITDRKIFVGMVGNEPDSDYGSKVRNLVEELQLEQSVIFMGARDNMPEIYSAADIIVLPSHYEGLPNVVIEAMSCGAATIVSDVADNKYLVRQGKDGFIFPPDDHHALAEYIEYYIAMPETKKNEMQISARLHVESLCSVQAFGDSYINLCRTYTR